MILCNYFATTLSRSVLNHSQQSRCTAAIFATVCLKTVNMLLQFVLQKSYVSPTEHQTKMNW